MAPWCELPRFDGVINMRLDRELLDAAGEGRIGFRVYGWDGVWVSLGRNQRPEEALVNPDLTPWVLRPTGGAAVLHGHDVTVSMAVPVERVPGSRVSTYRAVTAPLVGALRASGVPAVLAEDLDEERLAHRAQDCFAGTSRTDIVHVWTRQKVCGCALRRTRRAVLLQASIPASMPSVEPASIIRGGVSTAASPIEPAELYDALERCLRT